MVGVVEGSFPVPSAQILRGLLLWEERKRLYVSQSFSSSGSEVIHTALYLGHHDLEKDSHGTKPGCGPFHSWCGGG